MKVAFAAIGGPGIDRDELTRAVEVLALRADLEEVAAADVGVDLRVRAARTAAGSTGQQSAWSDVELAHDGGIETLVLAARAIAAHLGTTVRAVASGIEEHRASGAAVSYRAFEVLPSGESRPFSIEAADAACRVVTAPDPASELKELFALLVGDDEEVPADSRAFRRKALLDDPRLARLATRILGAKTWSFAPDPSGRVRLKIDAIDGGKQISLVSEDEAESLQRATEVS